MKPKSRLRPSVSKVGPEIVIANENSSYIVSKAFVCSKNPRFKDLYNEYKQTISVDAVDSDLKSIVGWLYSDFIVINKANVFTLHELACQLNFDSVKNDCILFLNENFSTEKIPTVMVYIKNNDSLLHLVNLFNSFISRHFLRIINSEHFYEFSFDLVKYIISLDLIIESEYQVFEAIMKWIKHDESRIAHMSELMKCLRWCYIIENCYEKIEEDEIVLNLPQLNELSCVPGECQNSCLSDRVKPQQLICIYHQDKSIGISYYAGDHCWVPCGLFQEDDKIPLGFLNYEYVIDIIFDSGRSGLRLDFLENKYRWLEMSGSSNAYYSRFYNCFKPKFDKESSYWAYIHDEVKQTEDCINIEKSTLLEEEGLMNIIGFTHKDQKLYTFAPLDCVEWCIARADDRVHATVLAGVYYIITITARGSLNFRIFDSRKKTIEKYQPFEGMKFSFKDLQLASFKTHVILLIKSEKKMMKFDISRKKWSPMGQIYSSNEMISLTSTYLPLKFIKIPLNFFPFKAEIQAVDYF